MLYSSLWQNIYNKKEPCTRGRRGDGVSSDSSVQLWTVVIFVKFRLYFYVVLLLIKPIKDLIFYQDESGISAPSPRRTYPLEPRGSLSLGRSHTSSRPWQHSWNKQNCWLVKTWRKIKMSFNCDCEKLNLDTMIIIN